MANRFKKLLALGLTGVALCLGTVPTMAAEIETRTSEDKAWQFEITNTTTWHSLGYAREKANTTKVYVYWQTGGSVGSMLGRVFGVDDDNTQDCGTKQAGAYHTYYIPGTGRYSLTNYVYENHFPRAEVKVCGTGKNGYVSGDWSPDSVGSYKVLN